MTRINTNVNSLVAQSRLARTQVDLQTSLTRLSTGLRINTGKDDPAGLIASEALRSDITSINKALSNTQRANQIIATADSALGQVSSLLNDIRGLVTEAANKGALSSEEIDANQLQVDSSLEAINRIAQTTTFQGRRLLDGSLDFITSGGTGYSTVRDLNINQANLGTTGSVSVDVNITSAATKASIANTGIAASSTAVKSTGTLTFGTPDPAVEASGTVSLANAYTVGASATGTISLANSYTPNAEATTGAFALAGGATFTITAKDGSVVDGTTGNGVTLNISTVAPGGTTTGSYDATTNTLSLTLEEGQTGAQIEAALDAVGAISDKFDFSAGNATAVASGDDGVFTGKFSGGTDTVAAGTFAITAVNGSAADGAVGNATDIVFTSGATTGAAYDTTNNRLTVTVASGATISQIAAAINTDVGSIFTASNTTNGSYKYSTADNATLSTPLAGGTDPVAAASFSLTAVNGGEADGAKGNSTVVKFAAGATTAAAYDATTNELNITVATGATINDIISAINTDNTFQAASPLNGTSLFSTTDLGTNAATLTGGTDASLDDVITVTADKASADFDKNISLVTDNSITAGTARAELDNSGNIIVRVRNTGTVQVSTIKDAIDSLDGYSASVTTNNGDGVYDIDNDTAPTVANLTGGNAGGGLAADLVIQLTGGSGSEVFNFESGSTIDNIVQSINLVKDATGVEAVNDAGTLRLNSTGYGSQESVGVEVISEGTGGTFASGLNKKRATGTDVAATVNGFAATGKGNTLSVSTATLDLSLTVDDGSSTAVSFDITGGGAQFQLGPDVVSNQQARLGITSLNTAKLGSAAGKLYELASGGSKSLVNDITGASQVINDVIGKVTTLRGRLGAFQRTTLESNTVSLTETLNNLNEAQSSIRDADFARESANLTRAQILVQSGTQVLQLANQAPQNVLSLLR